MTRPLRGAFIVIEGLDRSGKSTQATTLYHRLEGADHPANAYARPDAVLIKFPGQPAHLLLLCSWADTLYATDPIYDGMAHQTGLQRSVE